MIVTAAGLIIVNKKILLIKRVSDTLLFPGCRACPGGKAEAGETPEEAAIREVKEETNLSFTPTSLFLTSYFQDRKMYRFLGNHTGEIKLQVEEIADFGWFTFEMTGDLDFAFDYGMVLSELRNKHLL